MKAGAPHDDSFTFHDMRAYYMTRSKQQTVKQPDIHTSPATMARVYERNADVSRASS